MLGGGGNGQIQFTKNGQVINVTVTGLKSAAYEDANSFATAEQGTKADSAVQTVTIAGSELTGTEGKVSIDKDILLKALGVTPEEYLKEADLADYVKSTDIIEGTENGAINVKGKDVKVKGLGSAAYTEVSAYATVDQGIKADSAVQSVTVAGVKAAGEEGNVIVDTEALRTALDTYTKTEADAEMDKKIATAQTDVVKEVSVAGVDATIKGNKATITEEALREVLTTGSESQEENLATQAFVNSSIAANAARFITPSAEGDSQWSSLEELKTGPSYYYEGQLLSQEQLTNNDYAVFKKSIEGGAEEQWRALYQKSGGIEGQWVEQYRIGSAFTNAQQQAIDSGITEEKVTKYDGYEAQISAAQSTADNAMPKSGGTFTGPVILSTDPEETYGAATKHYVDTQVETVKSTAEAAMPKTGGDFTGSVSINGNNIATEVYVNTKVTEVQQSIPSEVSSQLAGYAPIDSPTFTGTVTVPEPESEESAVNKQYVDNKISTIDVSGQVQEALGALSNEDMPEPNKYVSAVRQASGKITVERSDLPKMPTIEGESDISVEYSLSSLPEGKVIIKHDGIPHTTDTNTSATTFVSNVEISENGHVTKYTTNTLEDALKALGTLEINGGTASDLE